MAKEVSLRPTIGRIRRCIKCLGLGMKEWSPPTATLKLCDVCHVSRVVKPLPKIKVGLRVQHIMSPGQIFVVTAVTDHHFTIAKPGYTDGVVERKYWEQYTVVGEELSPVCTHKDQARSVFPAREPGGYVSWCGACGSIRYNDGVWEAPKGKSTS